jgi:hypothetical protein
MQSSRTWRDLLRKLIAIPAERQAAAERMNLNPQTLVRWVQGISKPTMQNLIELPNAFPEFREEFLDLIEQEYGIHLRSPEPIQTRMPAPEQMIPSEYLLKLLSEYARASGPFAIWYLYSLGLEQLLQLLDPGQEGMEIALIRCTPPPDNQPVRSLCEIMGVGNPPWPRGVDRRLLFLGSESLAGWVVEHGEPGVIQDLSDPGMLPFRAMPDEKSAAAYPLQRGGKIGGCLMASSYHEQAWTPTRLYHLEAYSYVLALPMKEADFYENGKITLHELPTLSSDQEKQLRLTFQEHIRRLRRERYMLSITEAEMMALQHVEATFLLESE